MDDSDTAPINPSETRRKWWVIILLALLAGPFPFVYCGQLFRAIRWQLGLWFFGLLALAAMLYTPFVQAALIVFAVGTVAIYLAIIVFAWKTEQVLPWKPYQKWWSYLMLLLAFYVAGYCLATGVRDHWCEAFFIPANSMNDTIFAGDRILVEKLIFRVDDSRRQSLVVFRTPEDPRHSTRINYVKRLIAVGGDRVAIKNDEVFVNGQALEEPYAKYEGELGRFQEEMQQLSELEVPPSHAFVMGDNRWQSMDSRMTGFIPYADFIGEAKCIFWSQEYHSVPPSRDAPQGSEEWGKILWDRVGIHLK